MKTSVLAAVFITLAAAWLPASAGEMRLPATPPATKPLPTAARSNACAAYGPGFVQVEGGSTCVKLGGVISVDGGVRR